MAYNSNYTGIEVEKAIDRALYGTRTSCNIVAEGSSLFLVSNTVIPTDCNVVVYRYINRRQKHTSYDNGGNTTKSHIRIKGWRKAQHLNVTLGTYSTRTEGLYYEMYQLEDNVKKTILTQAVNSFNIPPNNMSGDYFRQRLALELQDKDGNPMTSKLEFMMDYSENGGRVTPKYVRVHQYTNI